MFKRSWLAVAIAAVSLPALADEGMWQPHQLPQLETVLKAKGLEIDAKSISKLTEFPMNAVISLGGCTASFVSPNGLVVTNHHCAYGSIQFNSTPENNILENGFLAKTFADELPAAPGSRVYVTEQVDNVTDTINQQVGKKQGKARYDAIETAEKSLVSSCEADKNYRCNVYSFHGGLEYHLIKSLEIKDVRLVHNPAASVGKYGGDIDNWMWPRHTGDYSFYRAYVGKDGKPAEYSKDNVPFASTSYLKVSAKGVKEGDFVMVTGYPGRTNRYRTADEVRNQFTQNYPLSKQYREELIKLIEDTAPDGSKARIAYEDTLASLANYAKNFGSLVESYGKGSTQARKDQFESELVTWIKADKQRNKQYGKVIKELNSLVTQAREHQQRDLILNYFGYNAMSSTAMRLLRLANEQQKDDLTRKSGFQERDLPRFTARMKALSRRFDAGVDQAIALHFLKHYASLPKAERIAEFDAFWGLAQGFDQAKIAEKLAQMYQQSGLADEATRLAWMGKSVADFKASNDPFIQFAVAMYDVNLKMEQKDEELAGKLSAIRPQYMQAVIAFNQANNKPVYADANSTLRVTYGTVKGYSPKDGLYATPFTTIEGIVAKDTGIDPFNAPKAQLAAINARQYGDYKVDFLNSVPVNFLSTVDTTGGNSGSPTLNGRAELVGLLFDGVYESIIGDWDYDDNLNRSIHLDSRYMLWQMTNDGASNLLSEMTIVRLVEWLLD